MGWQEAAAGWREVPRGMSARKIWFDLAFVPLFGVVGVASMLMGGILVKHFGGATDVAFSKKVRMDHNHQGGTDRRIRTHNSRFGMPAVSKNPIRIFPFRFVPQEEIIAQHRTD